MALGVLYVYSYLVGSIPTAYIIGRLVKGVDIRKYGSGNVGAANLYIHVSKKWVYPLGVFEVFVKGASPVWLGMYLLDIDVKEVTGINFLDFLLGLNRHSAALAGASLLSIAGNNWSVFLRFSGGRGLTVASGALIAMAFYQSLIFGAVSLVGSLVFKAPTGIVTLLALLSLPLWTYLLGQSTVVVWYCFGVAGVVMLKRMLANGKGMPEGVLPGRVMLNRLLLDRDIARREDWINRGPETDKGIK